MTVRVAVIGAGPSGLAQLRAFQSAREKGAAIPDVTCFEKQANWGGLWNYSWRTGLDEFGEPVHGSMYRYLWSNGPKECLEFADYSFKEHFGRPIPSYPPRAVLHDYIMGRVEKSDARRHTKFCHCVRWVEFDDARRTFAVTVKNLRDDKLETEEFDHVVVASGHFSTPNVPHFEGIERFPGRVLHAHDFRDANEFVGKNLLVVGSSYSAEDIASQCYKYGARSITFSFRREGALDFSWPGAFAKKPLLKRLVGKRAVFEDGSEQEVDAIILCTGYLHHFPFMADDLRLKTGNRLWPLGLWKGVVWERNPRLFYLGMQDQYYTFNMFDAQAWFARDVIMGRIKVPDAGTMRAEGAAWRVREEGLADAFEGIDFQRDYVKDLVAATDYPGFDVDRVAELFKEWEHHKVESIMGYRDRAYASVLTGNMAPVHHTPWLEALDDSLESFLQVPQAAE